MTRAQSAARPGSQQVRRRYFARRAASRRCRRMRARR